ncbi:snf2 family domain-containing protein [Colletotrichum incanum]|uniref:Snf2 family domain-containing protein n=1 Tax=Colletotrichum incanum TaxID=1573173 RepID=A0A162PPP9_COLIC|nr:snf2 family domain-containing protein [Colletotrichum incanum]OHW98807.1 SNF2 family domain-containing protein [Colletotrichum incanum]
MQSTPESQGQEKAARRVKGTSFPGDDTESDAGQPSVFNTGRRVYHSLLQDPDEFDESVEDTINNMRSNNDMAGSAGPSACRSTPVDSTELFVADTEGGQHGGSIPKNAIEVKSEPESDEDNDFMIIDQADASSGAQIRWSLPRQPIVTNLETLVKKEPLAGANPILPTMSIQPSIEVFENRKKELQSKVLQGGLSSDELDEMMHIISQLTQAQNAARIGSNANSSPVVAFPEPNNHRQATGQENSKKPKTKRKAPIEDAAGYWARREQKEREQEAKDRGRRGGVHGSTSRKTKRARISDSKGIDTDEEELDRLIETMLKPHDAIQYRADQGDLPAAPKITATRREDQLKQMREAAPEYFDQKLLSNQKKELREATKAWGHRAVRCKDGKWEVKGLLTPLLNHQLIVGAWMMGRELRTTPNMPRGGILADAMGLGKTIETLSCIVGNQASDNLKDAGKGATLVICPSGQMISQWMSEVKKHCNKRFSRHIVHFKAGNKMEIDLLASFNIVFASYHQLRDSIPSAKDREEMQKRLTDPREYQKWLQQETGVLHCIEWHRVVLDEVHCIKNHLTHAAFACFELKAKHRWAVSGTPLINAAHELFSYIKFIRVQGVKDFGDYLREYQAGIKTKPKYNRLVHEVMYRRTQGDFFLGQPILDLPTTHPTHQYLTLSAEEMVIFRMMERCFRNKLNHDLEEGSAASQIRCYLVMLLRLRQAATHPFLLEGMMGEYFSLKDLRTTKERLKALKGGDTVYAQIGSWNRRHTMSNERMREVIAEAEKVRQKQLQEARNEILEAYNSRLDRSDRQDEAQQDKTQDIAITKNEVIVIGDDSDDVDSQDEVEEDEDGMVPQNYNAPSVEPEIEFDYTAPLAEEDEPRLQPFGRSDFGLDFDMTKELEYLERLKELDTAACVQCESKPPVVPVKGRCGCVFCAHCAVAHLAMTGRNCPECGRIIGIPKPLQAFNGDETDEELENDGGMTQDNVKEKEYVRGFDYTGFQHTEDDKKDKKPIRFLQISDKRPNMPVTPSAKMTALKETVLRWQAEAPDDKIIIFSQFNVVMKIIGRILESEGICFAYLSGKQNTEQRNKAVDEFQNGNDVKVLIVSLRAGGQCLNLTRGNRVILIELWWNHGVEQQAFARVFRIGQIKETHFVRFIVNTPIERRMLQMQVSKILAIDEALQDDKARAPKIGLEDIASLLGRVTTRDGIMHVVSDYEDDEDDEDNIFDGEDGGDLDDFVVPDNVVEYADDEEQDGFLFGDE